MKATVMANSGYGSGRRTMAMWESFLPMFFLRTDQREVPCVAWSCPTSRRVRGRKSASAAALMVSSTVSSPSCVMVPVRATRDGCSATPSSPSSTSMDACRSAPCHEAKSTAASFFLALPQDLQLQARHWMPLWPWLLSKAHPWRWETRLQTTKSRPAMAKPAHATHSGVSAPSCFLFPSNLAIVRTSWAFVPPAE